MKRILYCLLISALILSFALALASCDENGKLNLDININNGRGDDEHTHAFSEQKTDAAYLKSAATCTLAAEYYYSCSCSEKGSEVFTYGTALGHTEAVDEAVDPTCTESGLTEGKHCSVCNEVLTEQKVVKALGHTEVADMAVAPTCTDTGLTEGAHCSVCNEVTVAQKTVGALGHDEVTDAAVAPTCTEGGLTEGKHCSVCNEVLVAQESVDALGHTEAIDDGRAPTCTEEGLTEGKHCSACDAVLVNQTAIPVIPHSYDDNYDAECNECGFVRDADCAHTSTTVIPETKPTCDTVGLTAGEKCDACGETLVEQTIVPALGHTEGAEIVENSVLPTCTEPGSYDSVFYCVNCEIELRRVPVVVSAIGHSYDEGICSACGKIDDSWVVVTYILQKEGVDNSANVTLYNPADGYPTLHDVSLEGYEFGGWYTANSYASKYRVLSFEGVTEDITLYALWINSGNSGSENGGTLTPEVPM